MGSHFDNSLGFKPPNHQSKAPFSGSKKQKTESRHGCLPEHPAGDAVGKTVKCVHWLGEKGRCLLTVEPKCTRAPQPRPGVDRHILWRKPPPLPESRPCRVSAARWAPSAKPLASKCRTNLCGFVLPAWHLANCWYLVVGFVCWYPNTGNVRLAVGFGMVLATTGCSCACSCLCLLWCLRLLCWWC